MKRDFPFRVELWEFKNGVSHKRGRKIEKFAEMEIFLN